MAKLISVSIDLQKIDKTKIIKGKNGQEYYPLTIEVADQKDTYGNDVKAFESQSKEQREVKEKKNILGFGRVFWQSKN